MDRELLGQRLLRRSLRLNLCPVWLRRPGGRWNPAERRPPWQRRWWPVARTPASRSAGPPPEPTGSIGATGAQAAIPAKGPGSVPTRAKWPDGGWQRERRVALAARKAREWKIQRDA